MREVEATMRIGGATRLTPDRLEDIEDLINRLRQSYVSSELAYAPPGGAGVTWWEVLGIYVGSHVTDALIGDLVSKLVDGTVDWIRAKARRSRDNDKAMRPQSITIYGPDGKPLKKILGKSEDEIEIIDDPADDL